MLPCPSPLISGHHFFRVHRAYQAEEIRALCAEDPDVEKVVITPHSQAVFALFWLAPSPAILRAAPRIFVAQLRAELFSALAGRVIPHVVHVSAGCASAVVELMPIGGGDFGGGGDGGGGDGNGGDGAAGLAAWCQDELQRQLLAGALRGGVVSRCIVAIQCAATHVAATPPLPAGEWSETSMLVRPRYPRFETLAALHANI